MLNGEILAVTHNLEDAPVDELAKPTPESLEGLMEFVGQAIARKFPDWQWATVVIRRPKVPDMILSVLPSTVAPTTA